MNENPELIEGIARSSRERREASAFERGRTKLKAQKRNSSKFGKRMEVCGFCGLPPVLWQGNKNSDTLKKPENLTTEPLLKISRNLGATARTI